jgi:TM2 domain-containing membrane protein YozV
MRRRCRILLRKQEEERHQMLNPIYTANLNDQQRAWFYAEYQQASKNEVVGVLFALFLGHFGIHKFYMGQTGWGVVYLLFCWTGIPTILGFIECFLMPGRVRAYNAAQAQIIASGILASGVSSGTSAPPVALSSVARACSACGGTMEAGAAFCPQCGAAMAAAS